jgi:hypothetical protein
MFIISQSKLFYKRGFQKMYTNIAKLIPIGIQNAISQDELSVRSGVDKRSLRKLIYNARVRGAVICSTCDGANGGYYIPNNEAEALTYYRMQLSRINSAQKALKSVSDFIGEGLSND